MLSEKWNRLCRCLFVFVLVCLCCAVYCVNSNKTKPKTVFAIHCRCAIYCSASIDKTFDESWVAGWLVGSSTSSISIWDFRLEVNSFHFISFRKSTLGFCYRLLLCSAVLLSSSFRAQANFLAKSDFMFAVLLLGNVCNKMSAFNVRMDLFIYLALQSPFYCSPCFFALIHYPCTLTYMCVSPSETSLLLCECVRCLFKIQMNVFVCKTVIFPKCALHRLEMVICSSSRCNHFPTQRYFWFIQNAAENPINCQCWMGSVYVWKKNENDGKIHIEPKLERDRPRLREGWSGVNEMEK